MDACLPQLKNRRRYCVPFDTMVSKKSTYLCFFALFIAIVFIVDKCAGTDNCVDKRSSRQRTIEFFNNMAPNFRPLTYNQRDFFSNVTTEVCTIPKNGLSVIRFVSRLLNYKEAGNEKAYEALDSLSTHEGAVRRIGSLTNLTMPTKSDSDKYSKIVFIRDPIERFVSGWLFICERQKLCFDCGLDFGCFLKTFYLCWTTNMTYSNMCSFQSIFSHLSPQVHYCSLLTRRNDFKVIDYSTENINNFLLSAAQPLLKNDEYKKLLDRLNRKTSHAANQDDVKEIRTLIRSNRMFSYMLAQLYSIDYKIFEIDIPQFIVDFKLYELEDFEIYI